MANPALNARVLNKVRDYADDTRMTLNGTINKSGFLLVLLALGGSIGWGVQSPLLLMGGIAATLILALLISFDPPKAAYLSQPYALCEGVLLGSISSMYSFVYPGIVSNALILTFGCLAIMLGLYRFSVIRVTDKLRSVLMAATIAIALTYVVDLVLGLFGHAMPMIHQSSPLGIAFSLVVVAVAAFNLLLDFDMIEKANAQGAPKFMEWYGSFALVLTLVWLYLEILRLLGKLNRK